MRKKLTDIIRIRLSPDEIEYIKDNCQNMTCRELSEYIGCSVEAVRKVTKRYGMRAKIIKPQVRYTTEEREYVIQNYGILPLTEICEYLKRKPRQVRCYVSRLRSEGVKTHLYGYKNNGRKKKTA